MNNKGIPRPARRRPNDGNPVGPSRSKERQKRFRTRRQRVPGPDAGARRQQPRHTKRRGPARDHRPATPPCTLHLADHLLIPYGVPKWDIGMVRLCAVTPSGSHLSSTVPLVHIRPSERVPYRLADYVRAHALPSPAAAFDQLQTYCDPRSPFERRFLEAYRQCVEASASDPLAALAPIPQAHLYLEDPLEPADATIAAFMVKADFAFWTGQHLLVVEIDGGSHIGSTRHVTKDRALKAAGIEVVHILNEEVDRCGANVIKRLLPELICFQVDSIGSGSSGIACRTAYHSA